MTLDLSTDIDVSHLYHRLQPETANEAVSVIMKLRGEACNIDCLYCYEKRKESPTARRLGPDDATRIAEIFAGRPVAIELHGGEPLLAGRDNIAALLDALRGQPNVAQVSMQTNGTLLDDAWLDLFDEHWPDIDIGISLDGDPTGNSWRVGYDGKPTYDKVVEALHLLARRGRKCGIITVVTHQIIGRAAEVLDLLCGFEAVNSISFSPCFDFDITEPTASSGRRIPVSREQQRDAISVERGPAWAITQSEYTEFVLGLTARWVAAEHFRRVKLEPTVSVIRKLRGLHTVFCHFTGMKCDSIFTLYPDGRLCSCDELPGSSSELLTIGPKPSSEADVVAAQRSSPLLTTAESLMVKCTSCDYQSSCGGGCVATRLRLIAVTGDDDAYCAQRKRLVDGVAAVLAAPGDPDATSCRRVRWRPQERNAMADIRGFINSWGDPREDKTVVDLRTSEYGNVNLTGSPLQCEAADLDPSHPQWHAAIEPGVWPLVEVLTGDCGCVTYASCEGHVYERGIASPRPLHVGILPRDTVESAAVSKSLCRAAEMAQRDLPSSVHITIGRSYLTDRATGDDHMVLDVYLEPAIPGAWDGYFAARPDAVRVLRRGLLAAWGPFDEPCACR